MYLSRSSAADATLEVAVGGAQPVEALLALGVVAEDAHEHRGVAQVGAGADVGHSHEADAGILQSSGQGVAEDLPNGLIDTAHTA